ncbi:MAG: hypothetical protein BWZ07_03098 [Alphaproteobacteria bacterium ADurb.BinA280]|nr:MAG: hypothetical protein BWZ07_03098 [Alphaproteobacteria bacterium ADurb.BinA280]
MAIAGVLRDSETGQVQWSTVFTGVLTAGLIASGSSLVALNSKVTELGALAAQRGAIIDQLPAALARQEMVLKRLDAIEAGNVTATNDRFRASDAQRMELKLEAMMQRELARLDARLDREVAKGGRR